MQLRFEPIAAAEARTILAWRYEAPYDFYDTAPDRREAELAVVLDRRNRYHAAWQGDELVGFCAFGPDARVAGGAYRGAGVLDVGFGLRPDLTGRGLGGAFVTAVLDFGVASYRPRRLRLTVASFNRRAIRVYERLGFRVESSFATRDDGGAEVAWTVMSRPARM